ncbi:GNAT family N-acetyltransferase [Acutalibacter sp. 1XD8-36]|uniref:GNAT family N-acetyltransferase n=1 Tax=Acutalibacter sp. 1XD8-36 TaxID=2320852 RepID=UPI0014120C37|nr:GNAT family N-acetyltransferase [Acutalibacter sp. 1XD8-36]NBJ89795.1 N-acetyltransferase [Acutalibacter sp. 1XD8-36]
MNKLARRLIAITAGAVTGTVLYHLTKNRAAVPADPTALKNSGTRTIETERLILRRFRIEDAEAMYKNWASDPEVTKFLTWPTHLDVDMSEDILTDWDSRYDEGDYYNWAIELKEYGEPIGSISVVQQDSRARRAHIGYCLGRAWWRQGIMSEALAAVISYLFSEGYLRIESRHNVKNPHSGDVMKKCGMTYEGTFRGYEWDNSGIGDAAFYSILKEDYKGYKKGGDGQ